jgi:hypothetical protein
MNLGAGQVSVVHIVSLSRFLVRGWLSPSRGRTQNPEGLPPHAEGYVPEPYQGGLEVEQPPTRDGPVSMPHPAARLLQCGNKSARKRIAVLLLY